MSSQIRQKSVSGHIRDEDSTPAHLTQDANSIFEEFIEKLNISDEEIDRLSLIDSQIREVNIRIDRKITVDEEMTTLLIPSNNQIPNLPMGGVAYQERYSNLSTEVEELIDNIAVPELNWASHLDESEPIKYREIQRNSPKVCSNCNGSHPENCETCKGSGEVVSVKDGHFSIEFSESIFVEEDIPVNEAWLNELPFELVTIEGEVNPLTEQRPNNGKHTYAEISLFLKAPLAHLRYSDQKEEYELYKGGNTFFFNEIPKSSILEKDTMSILGILFITIGATVAIGGHLLVDLFSGVL